MTILTPEYFTQRQLVVARTRRNRDGSDNPLSREDAHGNYGMREWRSNLANVLAFILTSRKHTT